MIRRSEQISALSSYKQGGSAAGNASWPPIKLSSNESPLGPSPHAIEAAKAALSEVCRYPDGSQQRLRTAIGEVFSLDPDMIVCGNGSEELLLLLTRICVEPGDEVILTEHCFIMAKIHAMAQGARIVTAEEPGYRPSADAILSCVSDRTRMIVVATPNNPVGLYMPASEVKRLVDNVPENILIVLDAAYADFVTKPDYDAGAQHATTRSNVVMTRTFSKLYGLAGLRVGWCLAPRSIIERVNRIRTPFNVNSVALAAATAAVRDIEWAERIRSHNQRALDRIIPAIRRLGLVVPPGVANFYLVFFTDEPGKSATDAENFLLARNIIPRPTSSGAISNALRVTVGTEEENSAVLLALREFVAGT